MPSPLFKLISGKVPDENLNSVQHISVGEPLMLLWNLDSESGLFIRLLIDTNVMLL